MTRPSEIAAPSRTKRTRLRHVVCYCSPEIARCGTRTSGRTTTVAPPTHLRCVVCDDLLHLPCRNCGT